MPLKKYNTTTSIIQASTSSSSSSLMTRLSNNNNNVDNINEATSPKLSPNSQKQYINNSSPPASLSSTHQTLANQISSLSELLPNIIEATAASGLNASSGSASATITPCSNRMASNPSTTTQCLPSDVRLRIDNIFSQLKTDLMREFNLMYAENLRLQEQIDSQKEANGHRSTVRIFLFLNLTKL